MSSASSTSSSSSTSSASSAASSSTPGAFAKFAKTCSCKTEVPSALHRVFGPCASAKEKHERAAASAMLYSIENHGRDRFPHEGPCDPETRRDLDAVCRTLIHPGLGDTRLASATARLLSGSNDQDGKGRYGQSTVQDGIRLVGNKCPHEIAFELDTYGGDRTRRQRADAYDLEVLVDYFHSEHCPLVEPDKSTPKRWKNKRVKLAGTPRVMNCQPRLRKGTKHMLVDEYFMSDVCHEYEACHPGHSITTARAMSCICDCIKVGLVTATGLFNTPAFLRLFYEPTNQPTNQRPL